MLQHFRGTRGAGLAEYVLIVALLAIGTLGGVSVFGDDLRGLFSASDNALAGDEETTPATKPSDVELHKNLKNFASNMRAGASDMQPSAELSAARQALQDEASDTAQPEFKYDEQKAQAALKLALATGKAHPDWHAQTNFDPSRIAGMEDYRAVKVGGDEYMIIAIIALAGLLVFAMAF